MSVVSSWFEENVADPIKNTINDIIGGAILPSAIELIQTITPATPGVENKEEAGDELRPKQGTDVSIPVIYGHRRIGGILVYQEVEEDGSGTELLNMYQCWALCEGTVQRWAVYVDDVVLQSSDYWRNSGNAIHDRLIWTNGETGDGPNYAYGTSYGSDAGIAEPAFVEGPDLSGGYFRSSGKNWRGDDDGDSHRMKGIACEQISYRHHWEGFFSNGTLPGANSFGPGAGVEGLGESTEGVDIWKSGMPKLAFDVTGPVIKDNSGTTKESSDPAWILYEYLTNERYGCSIPADEIDTTSFATASGICGQLFSEIRRHDCNIILDTAQPLLTNVKRILATCNGRLHWINGLYTMKIDDVYSGSGEFNFLEKHIIGGINIVGGSKGERLNQVTAKFINPDKKWKSDEVRYPDINNDKIVYAAFLSADNDVKHTKTLNLGGVTNFNQARDLAKQACLRSRDSLKVSFRTTAEAMNVIVGDVVTVTHSTPAWSAKEFIVRAISLNADGTCSLSCVEHNDAIYARDFRWIPAESPNTTLPDPKSVTTPIGLSVEENVYSSIASAGVRIAVQLDWTSSGAFTTSHDVNYKNVSSALVTQIYGNSTQSGPVASVDSIVQNVTYADASFGGIPLTGGSGSGIRVSGSIIDGQLDNLTVELSISSAGTGYKTGDVLTFTFPAAGATCTVASLTTSTSKLIFSAKNHGFPDNMPIVFTASDATNANGVLPAGITEGVTYYVRPGIVAGSGESYILNGLANNFHVSLTPDAPEDNYVIRTDSLSKKVYGTGHLVESPEAKWVNAGSTISKSMLLQDFTKGTFKFRVRARNSVGSISEWLTSEDVELEGITAEPEKVSNFTVANHGANAIITVQPPKDTTDISHAQIKVLQEDSTLWADAIPVAQIAAGNTTTVVPVVEGTYVAKWVSSSGKESTDYLGSGSVSSYGSESVATFPEQELWAGTMDGFYETVDAGDDVLRFLGGSLIDTVTELMDTWVPSIDELGGRTEPATYTGVKRDLGAVLPARIHTNKIFTSLVTDGSNFMDYWGKVDLRESFDPVGQLDNLTVEVRVTEDDPAAVDAEWTDYREFLIIDVVARGVQIKVTFQDFDENSQFTLRELELLVDMVQKFESDRAKTATTITYDTTFYNIPDLVVTPVNMATGDYMTISSETKTGFGINFYNSSGVSQTRNYNYMAKGV